MRYLIVFLVVSLAMICSASPQDKPFIIMSYNVENLYDTIDSKTTDDKDFLPGGSKKWDTGRYLRKLEDVSGVIAELGKPQFPALIGLQEVENRKVLEDLINQPALKKAGYAIVHEESPDKRGSDVALLYRKDMFSYEGHVKIPVAFPNDSSFTTRDILYIYGKATDGISLHLFVNHWTSRVGGVRETETKRMYCAVALRRSIDLLLSRDSKARIILMGDFNDEPTNRSIMGALQSSNKQRNISAGEFYNLYYDIHNLNGAGSYYYRGTWNMLDQIMVSHTLINPASGLGCKYDSGKIYKPDKLLVSEKDGTSYPFRTYEGDKYIGGISDHLPVYFILSPVK